MNDFWLKWGAPLVATAWTDQGQIQLTLQAQDEPVDLVAKT